MIKLATAAHVELGSTQNNLSRCLPSLVPTGNSKKNKISCQMVKAVSNRFAMPSCQQLGGLIISL